LPSRERTENVAVIRQGAITQVSWDDACILCALRAPRHLVVGHYKKTPRGENSMSKIKNFITDESGMETLEYAVIAGLIAVVAVLVYGGGWGTNLLNRLTAATNVSAP
jgi:Flp pilus assembly pilin Flp